MKKLSAIQKTIFAIILFLTTFPQIIAQVKIGNNPNTINANSILELESSNKGFLPPRIALNDVTLIAPLTATTPSGMLIYSLGGLMPDGYYYWNGIKWMPVNSSAARNNYVLVKTATDFPAPVAGTITLAAGTLYEINGTITLSNKIDLNGCEIKGADATNDKLIYTGAAELFTGANPGNLKFLTISAPSGRIFNINASGAAKNMTVQNCFIVSCNTVGTIRGIGGTLYFFSVAYLANTNGMTFQDDNNVILSNTLWGSTNANTFETFTGTFNLIQILGGDRLVPAGSTGLNISGITSVALASLKVAMFQGAGTFVTGSFNNAWEVESYGLNTEKDDVASGNLYISATANTVITTVNTPVKISGTTTSTNLFRISSPVSNRLTYTGAKTKKCLIVSSLTSTFVGSSGNKYFSYYIAKNGTVLPESKQKVKLISNTDQTPISITCLIAMAPNDYIEVWVENNTDGTDMLIQNMNLSIK